MALDFPCKDIEEARLRAAWHDAKDAMDTDPTKDHTRSFHMINRQLSDYLWERTQREIEADRAKHPKAKRNAPAMRREEPTRYLP